MESTHNPPAARVCLIGTFPPAGGGQAMDNESFRQMAVKAGAKVTLIDLSSRAGPATWRRRASRIPRVLVGVPRLLTLLVRGETDAVYLSVEGGNGQLYDIVFASLIRLSGVRLFLHHDNYAYLEKRRRLTQTLVRIAGRSATHIVLCGDMKECLIDLYGSALQVVVASNSTKTEPPARAPRARTKLKTIGFISNLSRSKGVLEFLDVAERVCSARPEVRAMLAGPIEEPSLAPVIKQRLLGAPWITYLGPVYGETKSSFYEDLDVFVYPTRNDAAPRVLYEALAHGVVVLARGRGCIGSVVAGGGGAVIREDTDFVAAAEKLLLEWYQEPALFSSISSAALANAARLKADHSTQALIREFVSAPRPRATGRSSGS